MGAPGGLLDLFAPPDPVLGRIRRGDENPSLIFQFAADRLGQGLREGKIGALEAVHLEPLRNRIRDSGRGLDRDDGGWHPGNAGWGFCWAMPWG